MRRSAFRQTALATLPLVLTACAATSLPELKTSALSTLIKENYPSTINADPIEVYQRIASRAAKCWFGPDGPLRQTHIFHAVVQSPVDGQTVEIGILKRTDKPKSPWGPKVYQIVLAGSTSTDVTFQNFGLDLKTRAGINKDALAWANGHPACTNDVPSLMPAAAAPETGKPTPSKRKR